VARLFCCSLFLLLRAQKKKQEKGTPASPGPAGFPYFSPGAGRGKTRASPSNSSRVFSAPVCEARQDKWGGEKNSHWHAAEHRRGCRKGDLHCLSAASLQSPGSIEGAQGIPPSAGQVPGCLFFGSFLWASKEMNGLISSPLSPEFPDEQKKSPGEPGLRGRDY
jgi:hypothetical protein